MRRCVSRLGFVVIVFSAAAAAHAQTVDEIIAKNLEAKGGAEKWKSVSSVKTTGRISIQGGMELPLTIYAKRPNYMRQEMVMQDKQLVQAFDGTTGWLINPMTGSDAPRPLPGNAAELMKTGSDFDGSLINYKEKGTTIDFVGKEKTEGAEVYHLKVTMKNGHVQHYFLDTNSGIELKTSADVDMGTGQTQTIETEMSNYQQVDGIMVPHTVKQLVNGKPVVQMTIEKVEFNAQIDDALFRMPKN